MLMNKGPDLIVLTGFRATGKTAVGRHLARLCNYEFADTDALLVKRMGSPIAEAVEQHGWPYFREQERCLLLELAVADRQTVIATGGGAILHRQEWELLRKQALVIWLKTDMATTLARLRQDENTAGQRPALPCQVAGQGFEAETAALLAEREPLYQTGSDMVIDTVEQTPERLAQAVYAHLKSVYND